MIRAQGHGLSECYECRKKGKYSLTWTNFLYRIKSDNFVRLYCYECAKEKENKYGR